MVAGSTSTLAYSTTLLVVTILVSVAVAPLLLHPLRAKAVIMDSVNSFVRNMLVIRSFLKNN